MSYAQLLANLGFDLDPFAQTNADEEDRLNEYFIPPPFFNAVYGDLSTPKSALVFAPRGGGKTALKRKIEIASENEPFLCVTYNQFETTGRALKDIDEAFHLQAIARLLVVAVITAIQEKGIDSLTKDDRHLLYLAAREHLSQIDQTTLKTAIAGVKNFGTKAKEVWNRFTGPIGIVLNALLTKIGLPTTEIDKFAAQGGSLGSLKDQLTVLADLARKLGYRCVYVLVDKVDETSLTGRASTSFQFIEPLLADLQLLELEGYGFKLFLWDALTDSYRTIARPDRVKYYNLEWQPRQLQQMLAERLRAFSSGRVESLAQITGGAAVDADKLVAVFAQGSPRTMIRICKEILDQQSEIDAAAQNISVEAVRLGFDQMARNYSNETFPEQLIKDLQRNHRCDFTIRHVYSNVFKFTQQAGLNKVRGWEDAGAIELLGTIQDTKGAKASNHYGLANLLLAKHVFAELSIDEFVKRKLQTCPSCEQLLLRDWDVRADHLCHGCQTEVQISGTPA
jgi:hypothetical protein